MTGRLQVQKAGPGVTVQDRGRPGFLAQGLSRGGAADPRALDEAEALLGHPGAALEMAGQGGVFTADRPVRIALTGAPMRATAGGRRLAWNAVHALEPGETLTLGAVVSGVYGYLSVGGGIATPPQMGARATHRSAGLGTAVAAGMDLPLGDDPGQGTNFMLPEDSRFSGGDIRFVAGFQSPLFSPGVRAAFEATEFTRDARGNRQGVALAAGGRKFPARDGLSILSEPILPGDIQMTGDGLPFVLLAECQTTGGYPRIGTVIPPDLPRVAQAAPGARLRFRRITLEQAVEALRRDRAEVAALAGKRRSLVRAPHEVNLLEHNLISGMIADGPEP